MKLRLFISALALILLFNVSPAYAATGQYNTDKGVYGGWDEKTGYFTTVTDYNNSLKENSSMSTSSTPSHTGQREQTLINGTTNYQAHGWTTWVGVYHYTRARMETDFGGILTDSDRQWGWDGTEAESGWWAFDPDIPDYARTYYGQ